MFRKTWMVVAVALTVVALTPDTAEAARQRRRQRRQQTQSAVVNPMPMQTAPMVTPTPPVPPPRPGRQPSNCSSRRSPGRNVRGFVVFRLLVPRTQLGSAGLLARAVAA